MNLNPWTLIMKTSSFLVLRIVLFALFLYPLMRSVSWGVELGRKWTNLSLLLTDLCWAYIGFSFCFIIIYGLRKVVFHFINYAHIAVMCEIIDGGEISNQIGFGFRRSMSRFGGVTVMLFADGLLVKAVKEVSSWLQDSSDFLPNFMRKGVLQRLVKSTLETIIYSVTEMIMVYLYRHPEINFWEGSVKGATAYAKAWKTVIKTSFMTTLKLKILGFILRMLTLATCIYITWDQGLISVIIAYVSARVIFIMCGICFVEPYRMASMLMTVPSNIIDEDTDDPELAEQLSGISSNFREMIFRGARSGGELTSALSDKIKDFVSPEELLSSVKLPAWVIGGRKSTGGGSPPEM